MLGIGIYYFSGSFKICWEWEYELVDWLVKSICWRVQRLNITFWKKTSWTMDTQATWRHHVRLCILLRSLRFCLSFLFLSTWWKAIGDWVESWMVATSQCHSQHGGSICSQMNDPSNSVAPLKSLFPLDFVMGTCTPININQPTESWWNVLFKLW